MAVSDSEHRGNWKAKAACRSANNLFFFPESLGPGNIVAKRKRAEIGKAICSKCEVTEECLAFAIEWNQLGIWGGTTYEERSNMKRRKRRQDNKE